MLFEELTQEEVNEIYKRNGLAEGRAQGLAEGRAQGLAEGRAKMSRLLKVLKSDNRMDDYERAMEDVEFCNQLFKEYEIE